MGREAAHILKQSGVSLRLHVGIPPQAVSGLLVVVKLVGHCDMDGSPAYLVPGPLGWSHEVNGAMLPFSDLACDNLRGAVEAASRDGNRGARQTFCWAGRWAGCWRTSCITLSPTPRRTAVTAWRKRRCRPAQLTSGRAGVGAVRKSRRSKEAARSALIPGAGRPLRHYRRHSGVYMGLSRRARTPGHRRLYRSAGEAHSRAGARRHPLVSPFLLRTVDPPLRARRASACASCAG